jgi:hypothetical protein
MVLATGAAARLIHDYGGSSAHGQDT